MRSDFDGRLAPVFAGQHGCLTSAQARQAGLTARQVQHRVDVGHWVRVDHGVYRLAGAPETWRGLLFAACHAGGPRAIASHRSAAALWGLAGGRHDVLEVTCPRWRRGRHAGLVVHETKRLDDRFVTAIGPIPVATAELTLLQLGAVCGPATVEMAYERARHEGLVSWDSCDTLLARLARSGRNGVAVLRLVLARRGPGSRPTESEMETRLLQALRRAGLAAPVTQHVVRDRRGSFVARVDAAYPPARIALEYESGRHHSTELDLARDDARRNRIQAAGWQVLGIRRDALLAGAPELVAQLRALRRTAS